MRARATGLAAVVVVLCAGLAASASHHEPPADAESELDRARRQLAEAQAELAAAQAQLAVASALEDEQLTVDYDCPLSTIARICNSPATLSSSA
eukprot:scaffold110662_cov63-Phaeocystis_antarctica.AAC.2